MRKLVNILSIVAVATLLIAGNAMADKQVQKKVNIPAEFSATIQASNCNASPGPQIGIQGEIVASGLQAEIIFEQPAGISDEHFVVAQSVIPQNSAVALPPQSVVGSLSEDPFMWIQLTDAAGRPLTSEIFLGRCSQGSFSPTAALSVPVENEVVISASSCDAATGPLVSVVDGTAELSAINGKLIFRNTSDPRDGRGQSGETTVDLVMLPSGQLYTYPQQAVQGEISANPLISLQLRDGGGQPLGSELRLGRCAAISN